MAGPVFPRDSPEFGRALSFIDAIFGFSVTLLVTTLDVPPASAWTSVGALLSSEFGDQLLAFVISFAVVGDFWRTNHRMIANFRGLDGVTLRLCIYLAGLVVFIPFTTEAISGAVSVPGQPDPPLPTALYAANVAAAVLVSVLLAVVAGRRGLLIDRRPLHRHVAAGLTVAAVFLASIPVAYRFGPDNAKWCWLSLLVLGPLVDRLVQRRR